MAAIYDEHLDGMTGAVCVALNREEDGVTSAAIRRALKAYWTDNCALTLTLDDLLYYFPGLTRKQGQAVLADVARYSLSPCTDDLREHVLDVVPTYSDQDEHDAVRKKVRRKMPRLDVASLAPAELRQLHDELYFKGGSA